MDIMLSGTAVAQKQCLCSSHYKLLLGGNSKKEGM